MSRKRLSSRGIGDAVHYFTTAKVRLKFKGNEELLWALEMVEATACSTGLQGDHICQLLDAAASGIQVVTVNKRLIKALIPATVVPESAILKAVSYLCTRSQPISIQCLLLRWILVVYEHIDRLENVHALYNVLFHFLHYPTLTPYVCHLLFLLTRKEDIKLFRIRQLIQYQKDMVEFIVSLPTLFLAHQYEGNRPYLIGLLSIYRYYYPNLVHVVLSRRYKSFFPTYDRKWSETIRQVQEKNNPRPGVDVSMEPGLSERLQPTVQTNDLVPSRKRRRRDPIPYLHNQSSVFKKDQNSIKSQLGTEEISFCVLKNLKEVQENMDRIQFPSQMGAVLRSGMLQHLMSYSTDPVAAARFQFWLSETLDKELLDFNKKKDKARITRILQLLNDFSDFIQEGVPAVDVFLATYLQQWNGVDFSSSVFKLLSRCRLYSFDRFNSAILEPLRKLFFMSSVYFKCQVVHCLRDMLQNFAANELPRFQEEDGWSLFDSPNDDDDAITSIHNFISYVCRMLLAAVVCEKRHPLLEFCVIDFLELVSTLPMKYYVPFIMLRETVLFERLLISPNPLTVARLCSILCRYKASYFHLKKLRKSGELPVLNIPASDLNSTLNHLIRVFCNNLWRSQAFNIKLQTSVFNFSPSQIDPQLNEKDIRNSLNLLRHPAFIGLADRLTDKSLCHTPNGAVGAPLSALALVSGNVKVFVRFFEALLSCSLSGKHQLANPDWSPSSSPLEEKKAYLSALTSLNLDGLSEMVDTFIRSRAMSSTQLTLSQTLQQSTYTEA